MSNPDFYLAFIKMVAALVVVTGLALVIIKKVLPRVTQVGAKKTGSVVVEEYWPIDSKRSVCVFKIKSSHVVCVLGESGATKIAEWSET